MKWAWQMYMLAVWAQFYGTWASTTKFLKYKIYFKFTLNILRRRRRNIFLFSLVKKKRKNWTCHESMLSLSLAAWNFYFEYSLSPYLAWANAMEQPQKRKKKKFPPPNPPPQKGKKLGPSLMHSSLHWLHCNFCFQNCLPPFLAWTNSPS
jgi:hypothetical protein